MSDPTTLGAAVALGLPLLGAVLWTGRLQQRIEDLEKLLAGVVTKADDDRDKRVAHEQRTALSDQRCDNRLDALEREQAVLKADDVNHRTAIAAVQLAQTETRGEIRGVIDAVNRLDETVRRSERETRQMLAAVLSGRVPQASDDTPPHGLPATPSRDP